jgi:hypothetical protein
VYRAEERESEGTRAIEAGVSVAVRLKNRMLIVNEVLSHIDATLTLKEGLWT